MKNTVFSTMMLMYMCMRKRMCMLCDAYFSVVSPLKAN